jgi:hypothetical protein
MPSVLCEGAFIIIPEQEAALRTTEFQAAYARGVVEGLESYFRTLAAPGAPGTTTPATTPATTPGTTPSATTTPPAAGP